MPVCDRIGGASFDAIAAENAAGVIDVVHLCITLAGGDAFRVSIFCGLDVDAIRGAGGGAQKTTDALFETVFVTLKDVNAAIAGLDACGNVGIAFRRRLAEHGPQGDAETLVEREKCFADFPDD